MNIKPIMLSKALAASKATSNVPGFALLDPAMHIPDGFLSPAVSIIFWVVTILAVGYALWRVSRELDERKVPLMGVLAAAIFAGQMLNFTVAGGTSGHLMGAAIATILLGPWPSVIVMTSVVSIQALLFQDGGLLALGANIFNMGVVGSFVAYAVYVLIRRLTARWGRGIYVSGFVAAWASIVVAALVVALQLALSGASPANVAVPAMGGIHALIGIGEGLITIGALSFIKVTRGDLLERGAAKTGLQRGVVLAGLAIAILLAILSPIASSHPDGLEWVAEQKGFLNRAQEPIYGIIPDYIFPGVSNEALATIIAGIVGTLIVFGVALLVAYLDRRRTAAKA